MGSGGRPCSAGLDLDVVLVELVAALLDAGRDVLRLILLVGADALYQVRQRLLEHSSTDGGQRARPGLLGCPCSGERGPPARPRGDAALAACSTFASARHFPGSFFACAGHCASREALCKRALNVCMERARRELGIYLTRALICRCILIAGRENTPGLILYLAKLL
jgi:hypothetical protein